MTMLKKEKEGEEIMCTKKDNKNFNITLRWYSPCRGYRNHNQPKVYSG